MQQLTEFVPIVLFFIAFFLKGTEIALGDYTLVLGGFKVATQVLMVSSTLMLVLIFALNKKLEKRSIFVYLTVMALGSLTLIFNNELFLQWKPTVVNWVMAALFIGMRLTKKQSLLKSVMGQQISLPEKAWIKLDIYWVANFIIVGIINLAVAYLYSLDTWVTFKLYSSIGFTVLLSIVTMIIIMPYLSEQNADKKPQDKKTF